MTPAPSLQQLLTQGECIRSPAIPVGATACGMPTVCLRYDAFCFISVRSQ